MADYGDVSLASGAGGALTGAVNRAFSPRRTAAMQFSKGPKKEGSGFLSGLGKLGGLGLQVAGAATGNPLMTMGGSALSSLSSGQGVDSNMVASALGSAYGDYQTSQRNLMDDRIHAWNAAPATSGWGTA